MGTDAPCTVEVRWEGATRRVALAGELDIRVAARVRERLMAEIDAGTFDRLELDLSGVEYVDSTGMALLILLDKQIRREGREFAIVRPRPTVRARLDFAGLLRHLAVVDD